MGVSDILPSRRKTNQNLASATINRMVFLSRTTQVQSRCGRRHSHFHQLALFWLYTLGQGRWHVVGSEQLPPTVDTRQTRTLGSLCCPSHVQGARIRTTTAEMPAQKRNEWITWWRWSVWWRMIWNVNLCVAFGFERIAFLRRAFPRIVISLVGVVLWVHSGMD